MLIFESKKERKTALGLILRGQQTIEGITKLYGCKEEEVRGWLESEGVNLKEIDAKPLTQRSKEELIQEIYSLRSRLSAKDTRLLVEKERANSYKRLYEQNKA